MSTATQSSGYRLLSSEVVPVDRELVTEFSEMTRLPRDREVSQARLDFILDRVIKRDFHGSELASATVLEDGVTYRVNGKHTSMVLASLTDDDLSGLGLELWVKRFECDTMEDAARLYETFDSRMSVKSCRDVAMTYAGAFNELSEIPASTIQHLVGAFAWGLKGERSRAGGIGTSAALLGDNIEFCLWYNELLGKNSDGSRKLRRSPVVAAMWRSWNKCKRDCQIFWELVRDENGDSPQCPDRTLARFLISRTVNHGGGARGNQIVPPRQMLACCIHAWNAWRRGEKTSLKYYADKALPTLV